MNHAALREFVEEIGLPPKVVSVWGCLKPGGVYYLKSAKWCVISKRQIQVRYIKEASSCVISKRKDVALSQCNKMLRYLNDAK